MHGSWLPAVFLVVVLATGDRAAAQVPDSALCAAAAAAAEVPAGIPPGLLAAIGKVESGAPGATRAGAAWPWTINASGSGHFYQNKAQAVEAARGFLASGMVSMDLGCLQVNWQAHPGVFVSIDQAFDPAVNATVAARLLATLYRQTGTWPRATAAYHSMTPGIGEPYARKVLAAWANAAQADPRLPYRATDGMPDARYIGGPDGGPQGRTGGAGSVARAHTSVSAGAGAGAPPPVVGRRTGLVLPVAQGGARGAATVAAGPTGQRAGAMTLAAYRALPVRLAFRAPQPRVIPRR
jgi:hypothetical protein